MPDTDTDARDLLVSRLFSAPPGRVYRAFTDPEVLVDWLGPRGSRLVRCSTDPRVGGRFEFELTFDEGPTFVLAGTYQAVKPERQLTFTWGIEGENDDSEVSITFEPTESGTHLRLRHRGLPAEEMEQNQASWNELFDRLAETLDGNDRKERK